MNIAEEVHTVEPRAPRARKLAVGQHANDLLFDVNGNTRTLQRLDSVSEIMSNLSSQCSMKNENDNQERNSRLWENAVLQQIQTLIKNVQVSESLADYINKEILNGTDINANGGCRQRRKSCFSLNNELHSQTSRRQSVTTLCQNKSKSLPRTMDNNGPHDIMQIHQRRRNSTVNNCRRLSNAGQGQRRRSSVTNQYVGRRSSIVHPVGHLTDQSNKTVQLRRRRSSLAHAYQRSAMPPLRRMSVANENMFPVETNAILQRRRSSVKPPCFPVTKISSVQNRLHKIYNRRRRRHDRREVNIADVRKAFKGLKQGDYSESSDGDENQTHNNSNQTDKSDPDSASEAERTPVKLTIDTDDAQHTESETKNINECSIDDDKEINPTPRRKTSIQVRAWELSRRLRQRRREKRKGFTESDLI